MQENETNKALAYVMGLIVAGTFSRILCSNEPLDWRRMLGEFLLSGVMATLLISFGVIQQFTYWETIFIGGLAGMGSVRSFEWVVKILKIIGDKL